MGDHHNKLRYKSKTDTNLFLTRVKEEEQLREVRRESSEAHLNNVSNQSRHPHHAHSSCMFHVNFFHHQSSPKILAPVQSEAKEDAQKPEQEVQIRLRRNNGQPHLFCAVKDEPQHFAPRRNDGQPSLPLLKVR